MRFKRAIPPPYVRRSPKVAEVLLLLYLYGLSTGGFAPALEEFFGVEAGLSPASITGLTERNGNKSARCSRSATSGG
jgi:putative transposase